MPNVRSTPAPAAAGVDVDGIDLPCVLALPRSADGTVAAGALWDALLAAEGQDLDDHDALEAAAAWHRLEAATAGHAARALHRFASTPYSPGPTPSISRASNRSDGPIREYAADELAVRLRIGPRSAARALDTACTLQERLPATLASWLRGRIDRTKASMVADTCAGLDTATTALVEERVLTRACEQSPSGLRRSLSRAVLAVDATAAQARARRAPEDRFVAGSPAADGMADLHAHLTGYDWVVINSALNAAARGMKQAGDSRTMDQLRADALVAPFLKALHSGTLDALDPVTLARHRGRPVQVAVTVPASVLLGLSDEPGDLAGYGPIPASLARRIAADGQWHRILTDPASGAAIDVGTTRYAPPESLARLIEARDGTCRFPGCQAAATSGDLDHTVPFPRGGTNQANLAALCRRHHRMKHQTPGLRLEHDEPGHLTWTMPTGQRCTVTPPALTAPDDPLIHAGVDAERPPDDPSP